MRAAIMAFHEGASLKLTYGQPRPSEQIATNVTWLQRFHNLRRRGFVMVRMFRRLQRSGSRPRVVGGWTV